MALCSQAFLPGCKRTCDYAQLSLHGSPAAKRACFDKITGYTCSSSSDSLSDSDDQQSCYIADQIRAKRRASSRVSFFFNDKLSKAVAQYSDEEEQGFEPINRSPSCCNDDDNLDCKLLSSPCNSSVYVNNLNGNIRMMHWTTSLSNSFDISDSLSSVSSTKKSIPVSDKNSRARCFDYLVGAIDEAWARYCDAASHIESEAYGYNAPGLSATDVEDDCGAITDLTDYDTDFEHEKVLQPIMLSKPSIMSVSSMHYDTMELTSTGRDPSSCQLQALKDRLTKAKYFLQDLVDSEDHNDAFVFWKRWDMIKYATIELVEDDDEDDVIENTIDELEEGRLFVN